MDFKPIETQEQFEDAIKDRVNRINKKYESWTSPDKLQEIKDGYEQNASKKFELPTEMASRLQGSTEEELRADAKTLAELVSTNKTVVLPLHGGSTGGSTDKNAAVKELLSQFKD